MKAGLSAAFVALLSLSGAASAQSPPAVEADDPGIARRKADSAGPPVEAASPVPTPASSEPVAAASPVPAEPEAPPPVAGPSTGVGGGGEGGAIVQTAPPTPVPPVARPTPRFKLAYRRFTFVRVGESHPGSPVGAAPQPFDVVSLDFYPLSRLVRMGLTTQFGWQDGTFRKGGDYFLAESISLGLQWRGRVTPFVEGLAGGGYMRRVQFATTIPTVYWQFGVDAGAEIYLVGRTFLSASLGYLRPVNGFLQSNRADASFMSVYVDTWSVKVGLGF